MPFPSPIHSRRLLIRSYAPEDAQMYYAAALRNREHLAVFERFNALMHIQSEQDAATEIADFVKQWNGGESHFAGLFCRETGEWVGQLAFSLSNPNIPEYSVGYIADVNHEGKGYISEGLISVMSVMFGQLGAHRVRSDCNENNVRSWRLLERCGFTREGRLRENRKNPDGSYHGDFLYGILKDEFTGLTDTKA